MTITDTPTREAIDQPTPDCLTKVNLRVNDVTKLFAVARDPRTFELLDTLAELYPHFATELDEVQLDICSGKYRTVKFGLQCLNRMIEYHNDQVVRLMNERMRRQHAEAIRLEHELNSLQMGRLEMGNPLRPAWMDS